jgi:peptide/nickel transport system permease protein
MRKAWRPEFSARPPDLTSAVRSQTLRLKERPFVRVAKLSGMGDLEIILRELLPQMHPWLGANFLNVANPRLRRES